MKKKKLSNTQKNQKILNEISERKNENSKEEKKEKEKKVKKNLDRYRVITRNIEVPDLGIIEQKIECDFDIDLTTI